MFLTNKVKCFSTDKKTEPIVLERSTLHKFAPFLLPSALMFVACTSSNPPKDKEDWQTIMDKVIAQKSADEQVASSDKTIHFFDVPNLRDTNFNHAPENSENFWEIVKNGLVIINDLRNSNSLTDTQKKDYKETAVKMIKQVVKTGEGNEVDLQHPANLRTFIFFEKVCHFKENHHEIFVNSPGWMDEQNDFFGRDYLKFEKFLDIAKDNSGIAKFAKAFYNNNERFIITEKDSAMANAISMEILADWLKKQDIHDKNLWYYGSVKEYEKEGQYNHPLNNANYWYSRGKVVGASLGVDNSGYLGQGMISPRGVVIIHELQHVLENPAKSGEMPSDNHKDRVIDKGRPFDNAEELAELGPSLVTLALTDRIYKEIHNIPQHHVVDYGFSIKIGKTEIPGGEIATWANRIFTKDLQQSPSEILQRKEVYSKLNDWGNGKYVSQTLAKAEDRNVR